MGYSEKFFVGYSDTNKNLELSDSAILRMFEDVATMHSEAAGDGMRVTRSRWFLTAYDVRINKRPSLSERVECRTWSRDMRGYTASREFEIYSQNGELAVYGISNWARIDTQTGKLEKLTPVLGEMYGIEKDRKNFEKPWISKLTKPQSADFSKEYFADRNFIDANDHMNNVCYLDLAKCVLPDEVYAKDFKEFSILYRKAVMYRDNIVCEYCEDNGDFFVTVLKDDDIMAIVKLTEDI